MNVCGHHSRTVPLSYWCTADHKGSGLIKRCRRLVYGVRYGEITVVPQMVRCNTVYATLYRVPDANGSLINVLASFAIGDTTYRKPSQCLQPKSNRVLLLGSAPLRRCPDNEVHPFEDGTSLRLWMPRNGVKASLPSVGTFALMFDAQSLTIDHSFGASGSPAVK